MNQEKTVVELSKIVFRDDLYPRIKHDPALVQRYAENIDVLPPIEVNQHCELIDGWHRWTAHRKIGANQICIVTTQTKSESEFLKLAIERNSNHGKQLEEEDKKSMAIRLFNAGTGESKEEIARVLSVTVRTVGNYLNDIERNIREARKQHIFEMWMSCYTQEEIAEATGVSIQPVKDTLSDFSEGVPKNLKVQSLFNDTDFTGTPGSFGARKECQVWRFKHCSYRGFSTCSGISGQTRTSGTSIHHHTLKKEATGDCVQWLF